MLRIQTLYLLLSVLINFAIAFFSHLKDDELLSLSGLSLFSINLFWLIANTGAALNILEKGGLKTISYSSLWSLVIETGCALSSFEKETDRPITIGLLTHNQLNGVLVDLACLSFGIRVVPIPLNGTSDHTSYILDHAEITHLFIGGKTGGKLWNEDQSDKSNLSIALNDNESLKGQIVNWEQFLELELKLKN